MPSPQDHPQLSAHGHQHEQFNYTYAGDHLQYDFLIPVPTSDALVRSDDPSSPTFDGSLINFYTFPVSSSPSFTGSPELLSSPDSEFQTNVLPPPPYIRKPATQLRSGNRVPRPRNAFMIFRSEFWAKEKISSSVERDHRHISRIIGHCWNQLPEEEKDVWRHKAEQEKMDHLQRYPGYRFSPTSRTKKPVKRKVKRNGKDELLRCKQVAELLLSGKEGAELDNAVKSLDVRETPDDMDKRYEGRGDVECNITTTPSPNASGPFPRTLSEQENAGSPRAELPIFRSPLLPPAVTLNNPALMIQPEPTVASNDRTSNSFESAPMMTDKFPNYQALGQSHPDHPDQSYWGASHQYQVYSRDDYVREGHLHCPSPWADFGGDFAQFVRPPHMESSPCAGYELDSITYPLASVHLRNPFEYFIPVVPPTNQAQIPLDPLHWNLTSFST